MLRRYFVIGILILSALVDVPGQISAGTLTLNGVLTVFIAVAIAVLLLGQPKPAWQGFVRIWPLSALFLYSMLQCLWRPLTLQGYQSISLLWIFVGCIVLVSLRRKNQLDASDVERLLLRSSAFAAFAYGISVLYDGLGTESFIGGRSFALYAMLAVGLLLGRWAHGSRASFWLAAGLVVLIALSLSRTALVVGVILFPLARLRTLSLRDFKRIVIIGGIAAFGLYYLVISVNALRTRFLGDSSLVDYLSGDASVDTSGRLAAWILTVASFSESPWLGKGPGTANDLNGEPSADRHTATEVELAHPLNEYLRFLHDEGVLGLSLFLAGWVQLLIVSRNAYRIRVDASDPSASFYLGVFLALVAVLITMITDNTASYTYVMAPAAILVGTVLRTQKQVALNATAERARMSTVVQATSAADPVG